MLPALLFSYTANAEPADADSAGPSAHASGSESVLTRWHDYALATITPQFTWAALPATNAAPNVLDQYGARLDMPPLFSSGPARNTHVSLSVATGMVSDTPSHLASQAATVLGMPQSGVERTVVTPSLVQQFDDGSSAKLSAVLAYQRYASLGLGMSQFGNQVQPASAWAAEWQYHLRHGSVGDMRPDNPRYSRLINIWQRLPLWLTRRLGPRVVRGIP